jgi:hypothetical protein
MTCDSKINLSNIVEKQVKNNTKCFDKCIKQNTSILKFILC